MSNNTKLAYLFKKKKDYLKMIGVNVLYECFCCEYSKEDEDYNNCFNCPIRWNDIHPLPRCIDVESPYSKWREVEQKYEKLTTLGMDINAETFLKNLEKYAREIANLSEKEV